ncbi:esterase-like activity of phytase family protein [Xinfangfangia sp. CPCC 101601]|uniref:Esterase-like activity of phytase family protein n=1 Tax=Pseudogemmobacter lacusdianii TaxID=3069608 RepID=A0ABU0VY05_9RHOB|nr:esterase-like activity of phytase family protein [Xinfangfangia sp. CPCC 101601]MDQ2066503.1 esterase-like activity of phytase family protein [Xinfangfangia sp. CPCC 101601]
MAFGYQGSALATQPADFLQAFRWSSADALLGGLSGFDLAADGSGFVVLSDHGVMAEGQILRDAEGMITGIETAPMQVLRDENGAPLQRGSNDSEGIARDAKGRIYISFEGPARVRSYESLGAKARNLPSPEAFGAMQKNSALEALAIDHRGWLYTMPERSGALDRPFPVFVFDGAEWSQPFDIPREGDFLPVSADFGPDGRLYLLERAFRGVRGFASRVRVFDIGAQGAGPGETVLQTEVGTHDNLEGLAIWRDAQGRIRLTMVSDNNFYFFLRQEVVEYVLPEDAGPVDVGLAED